MLYCEPLEGRRYLSAFYVSPAGSDANRGTRAKAFQTIQHAANVAKPGDTVFIEAGVYRETVTVPHSGTAKRPITFEAYRNQSVTIDGTDPVAGFTTGAGNVLTTSQMTWNLGDGNNQLFLNGQPLTEAQWPNAPTSPTSVFDQNFDTVVAAAIQPAANGLDNALVTSPDLTAAAGAYVGGTIHISPGDQWAFQTGTIFKSSPGTLVFSYTPFDGSSDESPRAGSRFYITGVPAVLDAPGEWYVDPVAQTLSLVPPTNGFSGTVDAKHRLYGFDLSNASNINIVGINLFACTINTSSSSNHIVLNQLSAKYVSQRMNIAEPFSIKDSPHNTGIMINGSNSTIENSTIQYSSGDGIFLGGSNNTVINTTVSDVDYAGGDETAVSVRGAHNRVTQSTLFNTGRSGVRIDAGGADQIDHNRIYSVGLLTTDLGAIYTFSMDGAGTQIDYNIISGAHTSGFGAAGIYLDNDSSNFIVHHNVVYDVDFALKMNPDSTNNRIYNNTLIGTQNSIASSFSEAMPGSVFANNILGGPATIGPGATETNDLETSQVSFVSAAAANYQLLKGSSGIDKGIKLPPYTNGYKGKAPDIGAYEYKDKPAAVGRQKKRVK